MSEVATLFPLDNWLKLYRMTVETVSKHESRGEVLGVPITRRWLKSVTDRWVEDVRSREPVRATEHAFEIVHPQFTVKIDGADLSDVFRTRFQNRDAVLSVMLEGDFDAYDRFQVLLKMADDPDA